MGSPLAALDLTVNNLERYVKVIQILEAYTYI